jgi:hypothetical protein
MKLLLERLGLLIRARYPVVQLVTHEEARADRAFEKVAGQEGMQVYRWSVTKGLRGPRGRVKESRDPASALGALEHVSEPTVFIFSDLHAHLDDPRVVRRVRDAARLVGGRRQVLLLVGPSSRLPPDLDKEVMLLDVPLPDREELARLLAVLLQSQDLDVPPARFERFVKGALGLTEEECKRLFARILISGGGFSKKDLRELVEEKRQVIRRSRFLEFWDAGDTGGQVGGMDSLKVWLGQRQAGFTLAARDYGLPEPRGVFLLGVQGCGKSLMAKAIADLWQLPLLRLDVAAVFTSSTGDAENSLRETVRVAESLAPAVLWIDEIEKGFNGADGGGGDAFGYFLTWMQEKSKPVFVVATANEVRLLPPELLRKGRFDEIFFVDLPNVHERLTIIDIHLRRRGRNPDDFDLTQVAEETEQFSGAELEQVVVSSLFSAFAEGREMNSHDLLDIGREMIPLAVTMDDRLKSLREWARPRTRRASLDRRRVDFFEEWEDVAPG